MENKEIMPVRIRLELQHECLSDYEKRMLQRYGESNSGSIIRDILIPSDMPLHNLHYAIQRLFGWENSHLRCFNLPEQEYNKLTNGSVKGWSELVGILFQPPSENEEDCYWDEDYRSGNHKVWLRKKYTGPYKYGGYYEHYDNAQEDVHELLNHYQMMDVHESFDDYLKRVKENGEDDKSKYIIKRAPMIDLTLKEMLDSIWVHGTKDLLERLVVAQILASEDEQLNSNGLFPLAHEIIYTYDFGANWQIKITKYNGCEDLINDNLISKEELQDAVNTVMDKYQPVCLHKEGVNVLDDVGGLCGFADFLGLIYESDDKQEVAGMKMWSKSLGWNDKRIAPKRML